MKKFKIVEFEPCYQEDAKDLLLELQTHLLSLGGLPPKPTFRDEYLPYLLSEIKKHDGKIFLAVKNGGAIGLVSCEIFFGEGDDAFLIDPPKCGFVADLVVAKDMRGKGVGKALISVAEEFFVSKGCDRFELTVFAPNKPAYEFYIAQGFETRMHYMMRKINR